MASKCLTKIVQSRRNSLKNVVEGAERLTKKSLKKIRDEARHGVRKALKG